MKESLKQDLESLIISENIAKLPTEPLKNYPELKKVLGKANGVYKRNTFVFPCSAKAVIDVLLSGKVIDFKKEFQFFATPENLANRIVQDIIFMKAKIKVCEPSGGHGALIEALLKVLPSDIEIEIDIIELSDLNFSILQEKFKNDSRINLIQGDFLQYQTNKRYDLILANPPFSKNQDIDHIKHMYDILEDQGQLLTLSSKSWKHGSQKKQKEFRYWLDYITACFTDIESGAFKSSGTNVASTYISIVK